MTANDNGTHSIDSGLFTLVLLLRWQGIEAEIEAVRSKCGPGPATVAAMVRCAKSLGLAGGASRVGWRELSRARLPVIAGLTDGEFLLVSKVTEQNVLVVEANLPRPRTILRSEFEKRWNGTIVFLTRRDRTRTGPSKRGNSRGLSPATFINESTLPITKLAQDTISLARHAGQRAVTPITKLAQDTISLAKHAGQ